MDTSRESDSEPKPEAATRRIRTLDEKLRILAEAAQPGASVACVARQHDLNANLLFAWRRMQRRGLLESQRHAPPTLLPVTITSPTITPTQRSSRSAAAGQSPSRTTKMPAAACVEIAIGGEVCIRLHGEAQQAVLGRLLEWLPRR